MSVEQKARERIETVRRSARLDRLLARAPRVLFIAAVTVTSLLGLRELVAPVPIPAGSTVAPRAADPTAEDLALRFARAYLTYDVARPGARERALAPFLSEELDFDAGFEARSGSREVLWAHVADRHQASSGTELIVVAAQTSAETAPIYLAVSVGRAGDGALRLDSYPAVVGPPRVSRTVAPERDEVEGRELVAVSRRVIANYLAGEQANLAADLAPGAQVSLPGLRFRLRSVEEATWADGHGSGAVVVTVRAADELGSIWTLTYELGIARRAGRPYVTFVETSPTQLEED